MDAGADDGAATPAVAGAALPEITFDADAKAGDEAPANEAPPASPDASVRARGRWTKLRDAVHAAGADAELFLKRRSHREADDIAHKAREICDLGPPPSLVWPALVLPGGANATPTSRFWLLLRGRDALPVIHPEGHLRFQWDIIQVISLVYGKPASSFLSCGRRRGRRAGSSEDGPPPRRRTRVVAAGTCRCSCPCASASRGRPWAYGSGSTRSWTSTSSSTSRRAS